MSELIQMNRQLRRHMEELSPLLDDILFQPSGEPAKIVAGQFIDWNTWTGPGAIPDYLQNFSWDDIRITAEDLSPKGWLGVTYQTFPEKMPRIEIDYGSVDDLADILHEMTHVAENFIIAAGASYYSVVTLYLYKDLTARGVEDLDALIQFDARRINDDTCNHKNPHDLLFWMKALQLDIIQGYPWGTVGGYGRRKMIRDYEALRDIERANNYPLDCLHRNKPVKPPRRA